MKQRVTNSGSFRKNDDFSCFFLLQVDDISKIISHRQIVELAF